jgi:hypothetical protein
MDIKLSSFIYYNDKTINKAFNEIYRRYGFKFNYIKSSAIKPGQRPNFIWGKSPYDIWICDIIPQLIYLLLMYLNRIRLFPQFSKMVYDYIGTKEYISNIHFIVNSIIDPYRESSFMNKFFDCIGFDGEPEPETEPETEPEPESEYSELGRFYDDGFFSPFKRLLGSTL